MHRKARRKRPLRPGGGSGGSLRKTGSRKERPYDRLLRKQAELENFRKRTQKEKEDLRQYAAESLIRSLLPTLDGFERAFQHRDESVPAAFYRGWNSFTVNFAKCWAGPGWQPIDTTGQLFDPYLHQAVETVNAPGRREHEIVEELQRGYRLKNKLLRPAIVKVAVGGSPAPDTGG